MQSHNNLQAIERMNRRIAEIPTPTAFERIADAWFLQNLAVRRWGGVFGRLSLLLIPFGVLMLLWLRGAFTG